MSKNSKKCCVYRRSMLSRFTCFQSLNFDYLPPIAMHFINAVSPWLKGPANLRKGIPFTLVITNLLGGTEREEETRLGKFWFNFGKIREKCATSIDENSWWYWTSEFSYFLFFDLTLLYFEFPFIWIFDSVKILTSINFSCFTLNVL